MARKWKKQMAITPTVCIEVVKSGKTTEAK